MNPDAREKLDATGASKLVCAALWRYVTEHMPVGHFLTAVLSNDLHEAVAHADDENLPALPALVRWIYWEAPGTCWGNHRTVMNWIEKGTRDE